MLVQEKELIKAARDGDRSAFGKLYDAYIRLVYNFIFYKTYHKETAEDLTSQTFFKALANISRVDPEKSFVSWLYKIAQNNVIDYYRKDRKTANVDDFWDLSDGDSDPVSDAENAIHAKKLKEHIKKLSAIERDIIFMRVWQELSYKEIAELVGKSEANCKMIYSRSLAKLRETMPLPLLLLLAIKL